MSVSLSELSLLVKGKTTLCGEQTDCRCSENVFLKVKENTYELKQNILLGKIML